MRSKSESVKNWPASAPVSNNVSVLLKSDMALDAERDGLDFVTFYVVVICSATWFRESSGCCSKLTCRNPLSTLVYYAASFSPEAHFQDGQALVRSGEAPRVPYPSMCGVCHGRKSPPTRFCIRKERNRKASLPMSLAGGLETLMKPSLTVRVHDRILQLEFFERAVTAFDGIMV
jgi:cytochrome c553